MQQYPAGDANLYRYAFNVPTVYRDPSGLTTAVGYAVMSTVLKFVGDIDVKVCVSDESTRIVFTASLDVRGWGVEATRGYVIASSGIPVPRTKQMAMCVESCAQLYVTAFANGVFGVVGLSLDYFNQVAAKWGDALAVRSRPDSGGWTRRRPCRPGPAASMPSFGGVLGPGRRSSWIVASSLLPALRHRRLDALCTHPMRWRNCLAPSVTGGHGEDAIVAKSSTPPTGLFADSPFAFADRFLQDHAGQIISEPLTAILELIANAYDAGATTIDLIWPSEKGQKFSVTDDGIGMTKAEFEKRWRTLCYDREAEQGNVVTFPKGVKGVKRTAFGRSGKGRHAPFCFADSYEITTMKDGDCIHVRVGLATAGTTPFVITLLGESKKLRGHGTEVSAVLGKHLLGVDELRQLIGSKFIVDPSLCIRVNRQPVELLSLEGLKTTDIPVGNHGTVTVHFIDSIEHYRSAKLRGITWWVNQRRVGEPSWGRLDDAGAYLDGRTEHAKKFSFIVMADFLTPGQDVKADWSGFHANQRTNAVRDAVHGYVIKEIHAQLATTRKERKKGAIENSRELMGELPPISRKTVGQFIDEVQELCPTISDRDLSRTVQVLAKLERSRAGYDLLTQLAACTADDLDTWNSLMQRWTASNAEIVLDELDRRLKLIARMEQLVENPHADELHDLQPLFERGLWIFGPEYEAVDFRSNRGLAEVVGRFLGGADYKPPQRRPDFVVLPEVSIGAYCADAYDASGEISGIRKVALLELKKGGFCVTQKEADQARDYAKEIRKAGRVHATTEIVAYVLGATLETGLESADYGSNTRIIPMIYQSVLRKAHQRTFNLQRRLQETLPAITSDPEVDEVLRADAQKQLFDDATSQSHIPSMSGKPTPAVPTLETEGSA